MDEFLGSWGQSFPVPVKHLQVPLLRAEQRTIMPFDPHCLASWDQYLSSLRVSLLTPVVLKPSSQQLRGSTLVIGAILTKIFLF